MLFRTKKKKKKKGKSPSLLQNKNQYYGPQTQLYHINITIMLSQYIITMESIILYIYYSFGEVMLHAGSLEN